MLDINCFTKDCIDSWDKLGKYTDKKICTRNYIFRGQRDSTWTFKSSLQRLCNSMDIDLKHAHIVERTLVSEFKRRFHQYSNYQPNDNDNLEWLSIMRHHMAPTRLLDWNYSIFIALYFALERPIPEHGAAVWALDVDWARAKSRTNWLNKSKDVKYLGCPSEHLRPVRYPSSFRALFLDEPFTDTACPVTPNRMTQRLTTQKGLFLCAGNPNIEFDKNIECMDGYKENDNIVRLIIPNEKRKEFLKNLFGMNITHTSLFPGLDGFSNSLSVYHHSFHEEILLKSIHKDNKWAWDSEDQF